MSPDALRHLMAGTTDKWLAAMNAASRDDPDWAKVRPAITPPHRIHTELAFYEDAELAELHRSVTHEIEQRAFEAARSNR